MMIWWLAFEKKPFQFWLEIWIQVIVVILLQLCLFKMCQFSCLDLKNNAAVFLRNIGISIFMHFPFFLIFNITLPVPILQIWPENTANQCKSALQLRQRSQRRRQNSPGNVALQTSFKVRPSTPQCYFCPNMVWSIQLK